MVLLEIGWFLVVFFPTCSLTDGPYGLYFEAFYLFSALTNRFFIFFFGGVGWIIQKEKETNRLIFFCFDVRPPFKNPAHARVRLFHGDELLFKLRSDEVEELGYVINLVELRWGGEVVTGWWWKREKNQKRRELGWTWGSFVGGFLDFFGVEQKKWRCRLLFKSIGWR